ncbi:MAG: right-handed parallel beta-helix repeat-containing protein [Planctomycetota bacterium]
MAPIFETNNAPAATANPKPLVPVEVAPSRRWIVDQLHPAADDANAGTADAPLATLQAAADQAMPGDIVRVHAGVYRERVCPARGGQPDRPIVYEAAPGHDVYVRGSEPLTDFQGEVKGLPGVKCYSLQAVAFGEAAYQGRCDPAFYGDFNPYHLNFDRGRTARPHQEVVEQLHRQLEKARQKHDAFDDADLMRVRAAKSVKGLERELDESTRPAKRRYRLTLGQIFVDGQPMKQVQTREQLATLPGTWMASPEGDAVWLHPTPGATPLEQRLVEHSVRHAVFSPLRRGLGYLVVRGFVFEHAANFYPTWMPHGWPHSGMVSTRAGHHWVVESNTIRYANCIGMDCGSERNLDGHPHTEFSGDDVETFGRPEGRVQRTGDRTGGVGYHLIRDNDISDNGHCGLAGMKHTGTRVIGNRIERNNRDGWSSPWWEFAGIKFHFFYDGLIEGNLIRDNDAHGMWIDNQFEGSRVTRNVVISNMWSGINVELGRGPITIDHNVVAHTRQGDGIYGHDVADVTIAHNLIYANANFGVWFAYATPRVKPEDGCWNVNTLNNLILGNRAGAVGYPLPWVAGGQNQADGNLYMGGGEFLDEGDGPRPPRFQFTNHTHMGFMQQFHDFPVTNRPHMKSLLEQHLAASDLPQSAWPDLDEFCEHWRVGLDVWRAALDTDRHSVAVSVIKDNLSPQRLEWQFQFPETLDQVQCSPVPGLPYDRDFTGTSYPSAADRDTPLRPGPFQDLDAGWDYRMLWPLPKVGP